MAKTKLKYRFIFDSFHFSALKSILNQNSFSVYLIQLMKISANSVDHKRKHCLISRKSLEIISKDTLKFKDIGEILFAGALDPQDIDVIEKVDNEIDRTLRYAQDAKLYEPLKSAIFTSDDKISEYQELLDTIKEDAENITLIGHTEAVGLIKKFHEEVEANLSGC